MVTLSDIEATSPPPPLVAVVEAIACAVSSYCSRVGVFDEVHAASDRAKVIKGMRFMGNYLGRKQQQAADQSVGQRVARRNSRQNGEMRRRTHAYTQRAAWGNPTAVVDFAKRRPAREDSVTR
jgi:hypothetical protein